MQRTDHDIRNNEVIVGITVTLSKSLDFSHKCNGEPNSFFEDEDFLKRFGTLCNRLEYLMFLSQNCSLYCVSKFLLGLLILKPKSFYKALLIFVIFFS